MKEVVTVVTKTRNEAMSNVIHMTSSGRPALQRGRLVFGVDATASRAPTWAVARDLQAQMFREAAPIGQLEMQLLFYGGGRCRASKWTSSGEQLAAWMNRIECVGGETQIESVLRHVLREHEKAPVQALTFIGDATEEEGDPLCSLAGQLGVAGVPCFMFLEGNNPVAARLFRMIALRSGGAFYPFNTTSKQAIERLAEQLNTVARLAVGDQLQITAKKE
jgi:hypothetical protein